MRAYERALADTMHSGEQAAIQACLDLLRAADSMEVRGKGAGRGGWGGSAGDCWGWEPAAGLRAGPWLSAAPPGTRPSRPLCATLCTCSLPCLGSWRTWRRSPACDTFPRLTNPACFSFSLNWLQELEDVEAKFRLATQQFAPEEGMSQLSLSDGGA